MPQTWRSERNDRSGASTPPTIGGRLRHPVHGTDPRRDAALAAHRDDERIPRRQPPHRVARGPGQPHDAVVARAAGHTMRWLPPRNAFIVGNHRIVWPAALASLACLGLNVGLLRALVLLDR